MDQNQLRDQILQRGLEELTQLGHQSIDPEDERRIMKALGYEIARDRLSDELIDLLGQYLVLQSEQEE